jgi:multidrug efflux pump subunit AcrA (membrane-fusion protein)
MDFEEINGIDEQTGEPINDITASQADFVVDSANYNATVRQAMFESMMELMGRMPAEVSIQLLDMVVDLSDLPGKEEMVKRIRAINGQTDPDEDTNDPEVQQERMARAQQAQEQAERERQQEALEMEVKAAKSAKDRADATAKLSKVKLDQEGLRINRAKALFEIDSKERAEQEKDQELRPRGTGPYIPANI